MEMMAGTIRVQWMISEDDLGIAVDRELSPDEIARLKLRLETLLTAAFGDWTDITFEGSRTRIHWDLGMREIEVEDGPFVGLLEEGDEP